MPTPMSTLQVTKISPGWWKITFDNPPITLYDPTVLHDFEQLVTSIEGDAELKIVTFESANPTYFMAHIDLLKVGGAAEQADHTADRPGAHGLPPWPDVLRRLENAPLVTVGVLRGRARGVGSEFLLARDVRFASRELGILSQPEIGFGFFPGGGGMERLPLAVGRARAIEIITGGEDFDADTAERYGWVNRSIPDADLDEFVTRFAERVSGFDKAPIAATKQLLNTRVRMADPTDLVETQAKFFEVSAGAEVAGHVTTFLQSGGQTDSEFELNLGRHLTRM
ncbi:enoyl-CoA hydratase/carnithine racemase [Humibacillus xanthopallidus]|uniref:Enoyl-CoA hydratase/carnithine racemase n=1 Tax=Humibacillus xanthopallidus TaxID=412689 RepID=A0A543PUE1_9MICO|nr:enoyl-CoA hydratase/isomerase family protein [Humibacillus xanthopallidus]TQN47676.1 enoyl-CoA hydratase/carnithine racemase [Humibacillus xanthopallidus]